MKKEIKTEDLLFLQELSKKMVEQDKRSTSYPLFVVYDKVKVYKDDGGESERINGDSIDEEWECASCIKLRDDGGDLPDYCSDCDSECFVQFDWDDEIKEDHGIFFTAKACDEYIASRRYEFIKPYSYAISAYWSEEMKRVMNIIAGLTADKNVLK